MDEQQDWVSIVEYARNHHLSDMTVRRRIKTGKLYAVLRDGKYFIPRSHTENNIQQPYSPPPPPVQPTPPIATTIPSPTPKAPTPSTHSYPLIPKDFQNLPNNTQISAKDLLDFCNKSLENIQTSAQKIQVTEIKRLEDHILHLEEQLSQKDFEIKVLQEQKEDLEVLVKLLDENNTEISIR